MITQDIVSAVETRPQTPSESTSWANSDAVWRTVAHRLEQFARAWDEATVPPELSRFLPDIGDPTRSFFLVECIKVDMEYRIRGGLPWKRIEEYAVEFPEILKDKIPVDLIHEEFHIRRAAGERVSLDDYLARFPQEAAQVRRMLETGRTLESTSLRPERAVAMPGIGETVDDFALLNLLGRGAFASVYLARQISMHRLVALKISADRGREPQTLAQLDHPHIVRVFDQRSFPDRGIRLLYMQYVPGGTLQEALEGLSRHPRSDWKGRLLLQVVDAHLADQGVPPPTDSLQRRTLTDAGWMEAVCILGAQLADALAYAADKGVLHRDLKPANILLTESAHPKLVDFNVSAWSGQPGSTAAAYFGGSLSYMSPEQIDVTNPRTGATADTLDRRSDIYSLGVILWEMTTGSRPFVDRLSDDGWTATLENMHRARLDGVLSIGAGGNHEQIPAPLREVLLRCLEPTPDRRYFSASQLAGGLRLCLYPQISRMLRDSPEGLRALAQKLPFLAMIATVLIPNMMAGRFNYVYNRDLIIQALEGSSSTFIILSCIVNAIAFPAGLAWGLFIIWPVAMEVRRRARSDSESMSSPERLRCPYLGHQLALVGIVSWTVAGLALPAALRVCGVALPGIEAVHFFGSLLMCGLMAASYPFFGATLIAMDAWYPSLLRPDPLPSREEWAGFAWLERIVGRYLVVAGIVPLLGLSILTLWGRVEHRFVLGTLSLGGLLLFGIVFALHRRLQVNMQALVRTCQELDRTE